PEMAREPRKRAESGLVVVELFERLPGGFLLGCLLRTALAAAELLPVDDRGDDGVLDRREAVLEEERAQRRLDDRGEHVAVPCEPLELVLRLRRGRPF